MVPSQAVRGRDRPVLVYDDDCGFCTWWVEWVARRQDVAVVGFSELPRDLREQLPEDFEGGSHLVTDEGVYSFGESMEEAILRTPEGAPLRLVVEPLRTLDGYERLRERVYGWVSEHRSLLGRAFSSDPPARVETR